MFKRSLSLSGWKGKKNGVASTVKHDTFVGGADDSVFSRHAEMVLIIAASNNLHALGVQRRRNNPTLCVSLFLLGPPDRLLIVPEIRDAQELIDTIAKGTMATADFEGMVS